MLPDTCLGESGKDRQGRDTTEYRAPAAGGNGKAPTVFRGPFPFLAPAEGPDELGWLGPYRVLRRLGQGSMGLVFLAEDPDLERPVALKVLRPELVEDPQARQRFLREARAMAALRSEHVVTIYQVGQADGMPYMAMEYLQGQSLQDRLAGGQPVPWPDVLRLGRQVVQGLAAAHAAGMIHRDIKPSNLFLEESQKGGLSEKPGCGAGRVKILDFGMVWVVGSVPRLTKSGFVVGTPAYMSPEQARGKPVDARSDLFSLGSVLYEMATGALPFTGANASEMLQGLTRDDPRPPRELNPAVPKELSDLILRLLSKQPADRPVSALVVGKALRRLEKSLAPAPSSGSVVPPAGARPVPVNPADYDPLAVRVALRLRRQQARQGWRRLTCAGLLAGMIGLAVYALMALR